MEFFFKKGNDATFDDLCSIARNVVNMSLQTEGKPVLTDEQMARLNMGKIEAGEKGIKDSLILIDQLAFIVNVPNNTVVTAMDQTENKSNVFTNIDGAVIA